MSSTMVYALRLRGVCLQIAGVDGSRPPAGGSAAKPRNSQPHR